MNEPDFNDVANEMLDPLTPTEQAAADARRMAAQKARDMHHVVEDGLSHVKSLTENAMESVRENFEDLKAKGTVYVKDNPTRAIMIAAGIGFVFGLATR